MKSIKEDNMRFNRRTALKASSIGLASLMSQLSVSSPRSWGQGGSAPSRLVVFYFPDGVPGRSDRGEPSLWDCLGNGRDFMLSECLRPLQRHRQRCLFLNGLSMGSTDSGSHPGGAKKLLTGVDGGFGRSVDQHLANVFGVESPFRHLYLSAMTTVNNPPSDCFISYSEAGQTATSEDDPRRAFQRLFGGSLSGQGATMPPSQSAHRDELSVLNGAMSELNDLRGRAPRAAQRRLDQQLASLRTVERRLSALSDRDMGSGPSLGSCQAPSLSTSLNGWPTTLSDPALFPSILSAQAELMALSLACGLTRVGVLQSSRHTSELIMSRFPSAPFSDPQFDMRSHQASHYGPSHDREKREFIDFLAQRIWFVEQFSAFLDLLESYPEGEGTLLDSTLVLLCTEVSDGNTHGHDEMPFVLAGGQHLGLNGGRALNLNGRRHGDLLATLCHLMGDPIDRYGQQGAGPIYEAWS